MVNHSKAAELALVVNSYLQEQTYINAAITIKAFTNVLPQSSVQTQSHGLSMSHQFMQPPYAESKCKKVVHIAVTDSSYLHMDHRQIWQ